VEQDDQGRSRPQVQCAKHGRTEYCLICRHLREHSGLGFYANTAEKHAPAQAWCAACDQVLDEERGWSDRADAFADWKLFCAVCYKETLTQHKFIAWMVGSD
jgi:hypothetical protein